MVWFLFNGISTFGGYLMPKLFCLNLWYYSTHSWEDKGAHTFPKCICPKINVIARLEYELACYDSAVQCFNHYTTKTTFLMGRIWPKVNFKQSKGGLIDLVWSGFSELSIFVGYLMPNPVYTNIHPRHTYIYALNTYDLVRFGFMAYQQLLLT